MSTLVSTEWLAAHLGDVRVVDASWYMPDDKRDPAKPNSKPRIFPARCSSTSTASADHTTGLPHMLPTPGEFSARGGRAGHRRWRNGRRL